MGTEGGAATIPYRHPVLPLQINISRKGEAIAGEAGFTGSTVSYTFPLIQLQLSRPGIHLPCEIRQFFRVGDKDRILETFAVAPVYIGDGSSRIV